MNPELERGMNMSPFSKYFLMKLAERRNMLRPSIVGRFGRGTEGPIALNPDMEQ